VDPGDHELRASAPGFVAWSTHTTIASKDQKRVAIPALAPAGPSSEARASQDGRNVVYPTTEPPPVARTPVLAWGLLGAAVVGAGVGTYFGLHAASKKDDSKGLCNASGCTSEGASLLHDANGAAWVSNIAFAIGGAALIGAIYLFVRPSSASTAASPVLRSVSW
jgi:hypothetical protein